MSGNLKHCPYCKAVNRNSGLEDTMKRVDVNDAGAMCALANHYHNGLRGLPQDHAKTMDLLSRAVKLGSSEAHFALGSIYDGGGNLKKAKFHYEAAAMAGNEVARYNIGHMEFEADNMERAIKHLKIAASVGQYKAMNLLRKLYEGGHYFEQSVVSRKEIDPILTAYNISCAEMRSEARDAYIRHFVRIGER
jgi:TPR repeat protein